MHKMWMIPKFYHHAQKFKMRDSVERRQSQNKHAEFWEFGKNDEPGIFSSACYAIGRMWATHQYSFSDFKFHFLERNERYKAMCAFMDNCRMLDIEATKKNTQQNNKEEILAYIDSSVKKLRAYGMTDDEEKEVSVAIDKIKLLIDENYFAPRASFWFAINDDKVWLLDSIVRWTPKAMYDREFEEDMERLNETMEVIAEEERREAVAARNAELARQQRIREQVLAQQLAQQRALEAEEEEEEEEEEVVYLDQQTAENIQFLADVERARIARAEAVSAYLDKPSTKALVYGASVALGAMIGLRDKK